MNLRKIKQDTLRLVGNYVLFHLVNILCLTLRINFVNKSVVDELDKNNKNFIFGFWHGTMLLPWYLNRDKNFAGLTSKSKDGDLLAKILKKWNYTVLRGSSSEGGDIALGLMVDFAKNGYSIAITPDGPKGPPYKLKAGAVVSAKKSHLPLVLVGIGFKKKWFLKSWDSFQIPKFFTMVNVIYSDPVYVSENLGREETSQIIKDCEKKLNELQSEAEIFQ
ncbi:MAG TPA: lysophospholipid acyltransferase family protein [Ignavibacteriaceae bacterium]|nr:lysophospholipid acyltransferase family protein [Ignavibacteriaceae bacterium]